LRGENGESFSGKENSQDVFDISEKNVRKEVWVIQGQNGNNKK